MVNASRIFIFSSSKAQHMLALLPTELLQSLGTKIIATMNITDNNQYEQICNIVRDYYKPSEVELFDSYFRTQTLGNLSPSQFLAKARTDLDRLQPGSSANLNILRRFFLSVLPPTARAILAGSDKSTIEDLADIADKIVLNLTPTPQISNVDVPLIDLIKALSDQVNALQLEVTSQRRSRSPSRTSSHSQSSSRSKSIGRLICNNHFKFKENSTKCCIGCNWTNKSTCIILPICVFHSIFGSKANNCLDGCTFSKN
jgi:hypothetical protein